MDRNGFNPRILREYAQILDPQTTLGTSVHLTHTEKTLTVFDAYPKAIFHFLLLPRLVAPWKASELTNLRTLLQGDKERALTMLKIIEEDANRVKELIEQEMEGRWRFKWDVWMGFHPIPSMEHLHLHIISGDLCNTSLKTKKHYNSFHPKLGFFLELREVLEWFEATPSYYTMRAALPPKGYEQRLKEDLMCHRCHDVLKNMPKLKEHLQAHWDKIMKAEKAKWENNLKRKRLNTDAKQDAGSSGDAAQDPAPAKKRVELESPSAN